MSYAEDTKVPISRTKAEIETLLTKHGCDSYATATIADRAAVQFTLNNRLVRFELRLPDRIDFRLTESGYQRSADAVKAAHAKAARSRWRALLLCIRAKLEAVESGIETFDEAFMPHLVMPGGARLGTEVLPHVETAYAEGTPPAFGTLLLPGESN